MNSKQLLKGKSKGWFHLNHFKTTDITSEDLAKWRSMSTQVWKCKLALDWLAWPNGHASGHKLDQVAQHPHQRSLMSACPHQKDNYTEPELPISFSSIVAKKWKTCANTSCAKVWARHQKLLQVHERSGQTESQVNTCTNYQYFKFCIYLWLNVFGMWGDMCK